MSVSKYEYGTRMIKRTIIFKSSNFVGMHLRPAGKIVNLANKFESEIIIKREGMEEGMNGKSIIGIMALAIPANSKIILEIDGKDEKEAMDVLEELISKGLDKYEEKLQK